MRQRTTIETLEQEIHEEGVEVIDFPFKSERIKGIYFEGTIGINKNIKDTVERTCILSEELGHHKMNQGNVIKDTKQEKQGRLWGFNKLIGLDGLIDAVEHNCEDLHQMSEYLEVTYEYLVECIQAYESRYGKSIKHNGYMIEFQPYFFITKLE